MKRKPRKVMDAFERWLAKEVRTMKELHGTLLIDGEYILENYRAFKRKKEKK